MDRGPSAVLALAFLLATSPITAQERTGRRPAPPPAPAPAPAGAVPETTKRAGVVRIESRVTVPAGAKALDLWVAAPRNEDPQSVLAASAPTPQGATLEQQTDAASGNTFLHLRVENPTGQVAFDASWTFERREQARGRFRRGPAREPAADFAAAFARELASHELAPLSGRIRTKAAAIAPGETDPLNAARAIYDEVVRSLEYATAKEGAGRGDVLRALDAGHGDAVDFASLFVTLARARGIPARFLIGLPLPEGRADQDVEIPRPTAWAEFFVSDLGWIPVDPADAKQHPENRQTCFGNLDERRILFTAGRDLQLAPSSKRGPHNLFIYPYAEVDGEPAPVSHRCVYKEK